jgi:hypothetical protein
VKLVAKSNMTLNDLFQFLSENPVYTVGYLVAIPIFAGILGILADDKSGKDPWRYIYMLILYMISIPGIFAITLLIYTFMFEQRSIYDIDLITHFLPIVSMVVTVLVTKRYVNLDDIPGFDKLTGMIMMITVVLILLWILDKTRIIVFTYLPFIYVILILVALLFIFRLGLKKVFT